MGSVGCALPRSMRIKSIGQLDERVARIQAFIYIASALRKTTDGPQTESHRLYPWGQFGLLLNDGRDAASETKAKARRTPRSNRNGLAIAANPRFARRKTR